MEKRIIELEKRVAYLDVQIEELTDIINDQQGIIKEIKKQLQILVDKFDNEQLVKPMEDETPPPHY